MGMSNKGNRALNSGAFLVRGEDRTSTGINRVLAKIADNQDVLDVRTRNSFRGDTKRLLPCYVSDGVVAQINATLLGGELLSTSSADFFRLQGITPNQSDAQRLEYLFDAAVNAYQGLHNYRAKYDYIIGEESAEDSYVFNLTAGRTSPGPHFEFSYIALSDTARDIAISALRNPSSASYSSDEVIQNGDYWGSADRLGTIYGPRYRTYDDDKAPIEASIVDFFTFKFDQRLDSLGYVNVGDPIIIPQGIFEVEFVGDDNKTVGVRPFSGDIGELFSLTTESANSMQSTELPTSLVPGDRITQVIIVKSAIGKHGEFYGVGLKGYDWVPSLTSMTKYFRVRCLMKSADSTATDDIGFRTFIRTVQEALDPYTGDINSTALNTSLRALNAVGGFLKLPKVYSIPTSVDQLHRLDYMTGSSSYGPLRVSPGSYAAVPNSMSIFNGIGGYHSQPSDTLLNRTRHLYKIATAIKSTHTSMNTFLTCLDNVLIHRDGKLIGPLQRLLTNLSNLPLLQNLDVAFLHRVIPETREDVVDFLRELVHITGRSLVEDNTLVTVDAANGITAHLSEEANYFSEEDVGRVFILKVPIIHKKFAQSGSLIPKLSNSFSRIREIRVRMHTWTSPRSARLVPVDDLDFYLPRAVNATLSGTVGYANVGYGSFRNVVVPVEHGTHANKPYPASNLSESTQYRHVYPGSETYLDVATPFTTSLHMYSSIHYLLGSSIEVDGQQIDAFGEDKSLFLLSEAFVTFVGEGFSQAHVQDGRIGFNHSNRARLTQIDKLTFLPFLRSSNQRLHIGSDDLLLLASFAKIRNSTLSGNVADWVIHDTISFSPNTYHNDVSTESGLSVLVATQAGMFDLMGKLRGVNQLNEYAFLPEDGSDFTEDLPPEWTPFIYNTSTGPYISQDELVVNLFDYFPKDLYIRRGAGGVRAEDAFVHKDLHAKLPDAVIPYSLNCEDLLSVDVSVSTASIGHAREIPGPISSHRSRYLTSNRVIYISPVTTPTYIWDRLFSIYGPNPTHTGTLIQYVGQETIREDYAFPSGAYRSEDADGNFVLDVYEPDPVLPPGVLPTDVILRRVPLRRRSWFRLEVRALDNTIEETIYFAFDGSGHPKEFVEYAESGLAVANFYGAFVTDSHLTDPTWGGMVWKQVEIGTADITQITDISNPPGNVGIALALHSSLKSHDLPYCPTAYIRNVSKLAPVSKELGKTLSPLVHENSGVSDLTLLNSMSDSSFETEYALISNAYPSTVQVRAGRVEKRAYDNFSGSGIDINVYDGEHGLQEGREDGVKISSLTRGYTDGLSAGDLHLRKKSALRVDSEETVFGVKVVHKGIATTQTDGAAAPEIDPELRVYGHLAFAGLLVEVTGTAWSATGKSATSKPTSLISPFSVTRDLRVDTGIPLLSGEKIAVDGDAVGLYIPWNGSVLGSNGEASRAHNDAAESTRVYNITRGFRNASAVFEGDIDFPVRLQAPEYDIDRAALAAFGRVSVQGLLDVYGDLYTTRFHHDNFGSNRVLAGVVGHLNPTSSPRAQNTLYVTEAMSSINLHISCPVVGSAGEGLNYRQIQNLVSPPLDEFNRLLDPEKQNTATTTVTQDSASIPHDTYFRYNRNATGISQQQLGERNTVLRVEGAVDPRMEGLYLTEEQAFYEGIQDTHVPILPTTVKIARSDVGSFPQYTLQGVAYHAASETNFHPYGLNGEYLLLMFSRPLAMWGDSYLGRTVVLRLGADLGESQQGLDTGWVSGVITSIVDSEDAGLTFVSIAPVTGRFDRRSAFNITGRGTVYEYPDSFANLVQPFFVDNVIQEIPSFSQSSSVELWPTWYLSRNTVGFRPSNIPLVNSDVISVSFDIRVQGREWVANTSQVFVSDRLFVCNDIGGYAEIKFYRDDTLSISSPADVAIEGGDDVTITSEGDTQINSGGDLDITSGGDINIDTPEGTVYVNGVEIPSSQVLTVSSTAQIGIARPFKGFIGDSKYIYDLAFDYNGPVPNSTADISFGGGRDIFATWQVSPFSDGLGREYPEFGLDAPVFAFDHKDSTALTTVGPNLNGSTQETYMNLVIEPWHILHRTVLKAKDLTSDGTSTSAENLIHEVCDSVIPILVLFCEDGVYTHRLSSVAGSSGGEARYSWATLVDWLVSIITSGVWKTDNLTQLSAEELAYSHFHAKVLLEGSYAYPTFGVLVDAASLYKGSDLTFSEFYPSVSDFENFLESSSPMSVLANVYHLEGRNQWITTQENHPYNPLMTAEPFYAMWRNQHGYLSTDPNSYLPGADPGGIPVPLDKVGILSKHQDQSTLRDIYNVSLLTRSVLDYSFPNSNVEEWDMFVEHR
jgi:hypothetical protein